MVHHNVHLIHKPHPLPEGLRDICENSDLLRVIIPRDDRTVFPNLVFVLKGGEFDHNRAKVLRYLLWFRTQSERGFKFSIFRV